MTAGARKENGEIMSEKKIMPEPQNCPKCGSPPEVHNPKTRKWFVGCSRNSVAITGHNVTGHTMFTRRDAIIEWNKLT